MVFASCCSAWATGSSWPSIWGKLPRERVTVKLQSPYIFIMPLTKTVVEFPRSLSLMDWIPCAVQQAAAGVPAAYALWGTRKL